MCLSLPFYTDYERKRRAFGLWKAAEQSGLYLDQKKNDEKKNITILGKKKS